MTWARLLGAAALALLLASPAGAPAPDDLFSPGLLHRVDLRLSPEDWIDLRRNFKKNTYYPAAFVWNSQTAANVGIRSRGSGSRSGAKPGLLVDFNRFAGGQTFLGLTSLVLDNLTQDPSGVRETVAMRLFARMGIAAPREAHTRLYVNGEYFGLYTLVEAVDKTMLSRVFGSDGNDGYLFEFNYDDKSRWRFDDLGPKLDPYKELFDAKTREKDGDAKIWGPIAELTQLVNETPLERFEDTISPRLDLAALVRYVALQNFVAQNDGFLGYVGMNNFYVYRRANREPHVFIAWDEDAAFTSADFGIDGRFDNNVLMRKAMTIDSFRLLYYRVLAEAATAAAATDEAPDGWLRHEVRRQLDMISSAMIEDRFKPFTNADHTAARASMLAFPQARIAFVRCEVAIAMGQPQPTDCP